jgi:hypothetical protein
MDQETFSSSGSSFRRLMPRPYLIAPRDRDHGRFGPTRTLDDIIRTELTYLGVAGNALKINSSGVVSSCDRCLQLHVYS